MIKTISNSLKNINFRLFLALLVLGLCPTVYTTVRVFFLGQLPGDWSFSIAGQLSWVNLLYEVVSEAIILPLFYFVGKVKQDKAAFSNRVRTGMLVSLGAYLVLSVVILIFAEPLLKLMAADESILAVSAAYIRIESVANIFSILANSRIQPKSSFSFEKVFTPSRSRSRRDTASSRTLTRMLEYPMPLTPRFKEIGSEETRKVSKARESSSRAAVRM